MMIRHEGFTIIELTMVVLVIGIISAVAIPMINNNTDREAEVEVARVKGVIRHVQAVSSARDLEFKVIFPAGGQTVSVDRIYPGPIPVTPDVDAYSITLDSGTIESASFGGVNRIEFDTSGEVKSGGQVTIAYKGLKMTINVDTKTGYMTVTES